MAAGPSPAAAADPAKVAGATEALDSRAEALFMAAEKKREAAEQVVLAPYAGPNDRASIVEYLSKQAAGWSVRKHWAIEEAVKAYLRIFGINLPPLPPPRWPPPPPPGAIGLLGGDPNAPVPPWGMYPSDDPFSTQWTGTMSSPRWSIAAASRVGQLYADFVRDLRSTPIPPSWSGPKAPAADSRVEYLLSLIDGPEMHKQHAKVAFAACLRWSTQYRYFDEFSRTCEGWLVRNYRSEYHAMEELHAWPSWSKPRGVIEAATRLGALGRPAIPAWLVPPDHSRPAAARP